MDRELVLAILAVLLCGGALTAAGWLPTGSPIASSGRVLERRAWRRIWVPFGPAGLLFAALCGWALVEPADAERVPNCLVWSAVPFAAIMVRAAWRARSSLASAHRDQAIATVGLFRPRIIVAARFTNTLDERALGAALAHERAHALHRDPLRLWLAQLGSDLLWPWPAGRSRFLDWQRALELARDEEARLSGIAGPDLAAAILAAVRCSRQGASVGAATLGGDEGFVTERVTRLMRPLDAEAIPVGARAAWLPALAVGMTSAVLLGIQFGERAVQTFLALF